MHITPVQWPPLEVPGDLEVKGGVIGGLAGQEGRVVDRDHRVDWRIADGRSP